MALSWPNAASSLYVLAPVCFLSFMLISFVAPIYSDRHNGLFKMMSTQSLLEPAFLLGTWFYSFSVQFLYSLVLLTLFYGSSVYRTALTPNCDSNDSSCGYAKFGGQPWVLKPLKFNFLSNNKCSRTSADQFVTILQRCVPKQQGGGYHWNVQWRRGVSVCSPSFRRLCYDVRDCCDVFVDNSWSSALKLVPSRVQN